MTGRLQRLLSWPARYLRYLADRGQFERLRREAGDYRFDWTWSDRMPALGDKAATTAFDAHYVYHTAWAVRTVTRSAPARHIDVGSTLNFCTTLAASVPVDFYDIRPAAIDLPGLRCLAGSLMALPFEDGSVASLSCMHVIEHVGLGRYGDPIDPLGDLKAVAELRRVLAPGGSLLFVVPVGRRALKYNAHRIYDLAQVRGMMDGLDLLETALVTDTDQFVIDPDPTLFDQQTYGCGCFLFRKPTTAPEPDTP